ncbi:unnamed protein product [Rotaria sp. Silwood1]|nr:unnamed protein product [Rotaria sp. Silwood1]CAF1607462.1 unnamed protein product [Rotaria sp. Silwood1]CAF3770757.1 unnamed protein product [Rotaria sp. Silwood1]CAF4775143.1 unnamed protein product [Rotaria sp. Silwood1]
MLTLVIEFGRQRRKFDLINPIDINLLENKIKSSFGIENENENEYIIQIYDEQINDYLDLTSDLFNSINNNNNNNIIKGQIISRQFNSFQYQTKVTKQQVVGLITLESIENSLLNWSQLLQHIQFEISKELETVKQTIIAVKSHYKLIDESNTEDNCSQYEIKQNSCSPSSVSQIENENLTPIFNLNSNNGQLIKPIINIEDKYSNGTYLNKQRSQTNNKNNRRGTFNIKQSKNRDNYIYYPPSHIPSKPIEYNIPITVTYQRFQSGVDFQGQLSKYYNPTYFFLRISNQTESYDQMHKDINLYYNSIDSNQTYFPQSGEFCVGKSPDDSNWYRARIIRLIGNDKAQLIFIDIGQIVDININLIQPLNSKYSDRPAQALACTLAQVLPFTQNEKSGWNRRSCMSLENAMKNERLITGNVLLKVTVNDNNQAKWPMMFINISTATIPSLSEYMCDLYLSRRCSNNEISEYWSSKIRPEQYVLFNLSSLINQKQYFIFNNNYQSKLSFNQTIDMIVNDTEFISRQ